MQGISSLTYKSMTTPIEVRSFLKEFSIFALKKCDLRKVLSNLVSDTIKISLSLLTMQVSCLNLFLIEFMFIWRKMVLDGLLILTWCKLELLWVRFKGQFCIGTYAFWAYFMRIYGNLFQVTVVSSWSPQRKPFLFHCYNFHFHYCNLWPLRILWID